MQPRILYLGLDPKNYITEKASFHNEIVHWPIIEVAPRPLSDPIVYASISRFKEYSHLILTSKTTVTILHDYLIKIGIDKSEWSKKINLVVGSATAAYLNAWGITSVVVAKEERAEGILQLMNGMDLNGAHFFYPHSTLSRPLIEEHLKCFSLRYTACLLYDTFCTNKEVCPDPNQFDEIVFTSPSTVRAFLQIYGKFPLQVNLTAIGPITQNAIDFARNSKFEDRFL